MAAEWFTRLMGTELGPFTSTQLLEMARKRQITPEDVVKKGRDGEWVPAYRVKGLFESRSEGAPATTPPATTPPATTPPATTPPATTPPTNKSPANKPRTKPAAARAKASDKSSRATVTTSSSKGSPAAIRANTSASPTSEPREAVKRLWYFISNGEKHGPMPFATLKQHARAGEIKQTDRVWSSTCPKWSIASDVEGLDIQ